MNIYNKTKSNAFELHFSKATFLGCVLKMQSKMLAFFEEL